MKILTIQKHNDVSEFELFLNHVSDELAATICKKLHAYTEVNDVYISNRLKILKPKIWGYKGTIYKLRVDCGKESARIMFVKTPHNDIVVLHGFMKKTQKTPSKDAKIAIGNHERIKVNPEGIAVTQLPMTKYSF
jgi:phage-related protein